MDDLALIKRRLQREIDARKEAEQLLEKKSLELYELNLQLKAANESLEAQSVALKDALEGAQRDYQNMVEALSEIVFRIDEEGNFTYVNPAIRKLTGHEEEHLIGLHFSSLLAPKASEKIVATYLDQIDKRTERSYLEIPVISSTGETIWLGQSVSFAYRNDAFEGAVAVARDITEVVEVRKALIDSEEKYRGLIEGMELGLMEVDIDGKIIKPYRWFCDMVGYSPEELIGRVADDVFLFDEDREFMDRQTKIRKKGQAGVYEIRIKRKDGTPLWVAISGAPYFDSKGKAIGTIGVHLDITPQKEMLAKLEEANREVQQARDTERHFFMNMSHEIRTPMNSIIGMSHLLKDSGLNRRQSEYLNDIIFSSELLQNLISNLLDLSSIESGKLQLSVKPVGIFSLLSNVVNTFRYKASAKGIDLFIEADLVKDLTILSDERLLSQILLNLLGNAVKFTSSGSVTVAVLPCDTPFVGVTFKVTDTGIGIPKNEIEQVFSRYHRSANSENAEGHGLGLAITLELVELLKGTISLDSELGKGTSVSFQIPATASQTKHEVKKRVHTSPASFAHLSVLVVEDNLMNQRYIKELLSAWKVNYTMVDSVTSSLEHLDHFSPDLLLLDLQLPDGSGFDVANYARQKYPDMIMVALTAASDEKTKQSISEHGIDELITKPFRPDELLAKMEQYFAPPDSYAVLSDADALLYDALMKKTFLEEAPKVIKEISVGLEKVECSIIAAALHKLHPMLSLAGNEVLAGSAKCLEAEVKVEEQGQFQVIKELVEKVDEYIQTIEKSLTET